MNNDSNNANAGEIQVSGAVSRKSPIKIYLIIGILIFVIAAVIAVIVFANAGSSYERAEAKAFARLLSNAETTASKGTLVEFDLAFEPGPDFSELFFGTVSGDTNAESEIGQMLAGIADAKLKASVGADELRSFISLAIANGGGDIAEAKAYIEGSKILAAIPALSDYVFAFESGTSAVKQPEIDSEKLKASIEVLAKWYFEKAKSAEAVKIVLTQGSITVKTDEYTVDFYEKDAYEFAILALNELKNNPELVELIRQALETSAQSFDVDEIIAEVQAELDALGGEAGELMFTMRTNIVGDTVVRRCLTLAGDEQISLIYTSLEKGNDGETYIFFSGEGLTAELELAAKKNASEWTTNGSGTLTVEGEKFELTFSDITNSDKGLLSGSASFVYNNAESPFALSVLFITEGNRQIIEYSGTVLGKNPGKITIGCEITEGYETPETPVVSEDKLITIGDDSDATIAKLDAFVEAAEDKLGELSAGETDGFTLIVYNLLYGLAEQIYYSY
ncbi:MAG: hypothetical protein LBN97_03375 [Oscillospiraceae bacterium]|jgi:hypothetical protein|nr:hypothetical protein [Oscillospiraceae bacterium]